MKIYILTLLIALAPITSFGKEVTINAEKGKIERIIFNETVPFGVLDGSLIITDQYGHQSKPTRIIVGLYDGSPQKHAYQIVLEQIEESDADYWLAYEYIKDGKVVIRSDIDSNINLNQKYVFQLMWFKSNRLQITVNNISHNPYVNLSSKTPFISVYSGKAIFNYIFNNAKWLEGVPPAPGNTAPIN